MSLGRQRVQDYPFVSMDAILSWNLPEDTWNLHDDTSDQIILEPTRGHLEPT